MSAPRVVVVGATGAVGKVALRVLEERDFPMSSLRVCASERSVGKRVNFRGEELEVELATPPVFANSDIAFTAVGSAMSREFAPMAVEQGCIVIDKSAAFRMESRVPLVVPEINPGDVEGHQGILAVPNCSTTQMVMALYPLHCANPIRRVIVDTYQSVSGTGAEAMEELAVQSGQVLRGEATQPEQYPHRIAFNILPQVETFLDDGYTTEERKMRDETRKIMHAPDLALSATCVRVPVPISHAEALHIEFEQPMSVGEARELLATFPGVSVVDDPLTSTYPMPMDAEGRDEVFVGRLRQDDSHPNGLALWVVSDNLRKGAATNGVQIAEELLRRDALPRNGA